MKLIKYRIVKDTYSGFEVQIWRLWFPFWVQKDCINTYPSLERAIEAIEIYKTKVIYTE